MKIIFIPVSDRPECVIALHHGFSMAKKLNASVMGCHIRPHSDSAINMPDESSGSLLVADSYDLAWEAVLTENAQADGPIKARSLFEKMAQQYHYGLQKNPSGQAGALWREKVGSPDRLFAITGPVTDMIVVSRPAKSGKSVARTIMMDAVLHASSPVMVLPQHDVPTPGNRVCVAWNQSPEAALAVKAALPLLQQAEQVTVVSSGEHNQSGPKVGHLEKYLRAWQIKAECLKVKDGNDAKAIMSAYEQSNSDLLVMGGYSRSRLRQRIFGGVTEYMLNTADIPVFLLHT